MDLDELLNEAIPLMAEDVREARARLGITSARAAKQAGLEAARYEALEKGGIRRSRHNASDLVSVARRLGLESVRASYVDEIGQYMRIDLAADGPLTVFIDALEADPAQLKDQGYFVNPYVILAFFESIDFYSTFESRNRVDKQVVEMWIAAVFTLCLDPGRNYYVRPVREDPPDVEVLVIDPENSAVSMIRVEITQHGKYSKSLLEVIGKKLVKRYEEGTVLVVLVEQSESLAVAALHEFIRKNNPHNYRIVIIGGAAKAGRYKVVPWQEVSSASPGEMAWMEMEVDARGARRGHRGYEGVVFKPPGMRRAPHAFPVFVKKVDLHR